ncbi:MAG: hypothetical protein II797_05085, partial [Clostridia bacterium]|nr:hypothetical protein [Clostridia bacterium]
MNAFQRFAVRAGASTALGSFLTRAKRKSASEVAMDGFNLVLPFLRGRVRDNTIEKIRNILSDPSSPEMTALDRLVKTSESSYLKNFLMNGLFDGGYLGMEDLKTVRKETGIRLPLGVVIQGGVSKEDTRSFLREAEEYGLRFVILMNHRDGRTDSPASLMTEFPSLTFFYLTDGDDLDLHFLTSIRKNANLAPVLCLGKRPYEESASFARRISLQEIPLIGVCDRPSTLFAEEDGIDLCQRMARDGFVTVLFWNPESQGLTEDEKAKDLEILKSLRDPSVQNALLLFDLDSDLKKLIRCPFGNQIG